MDKQEIKETIELNEKIIADKRRLLKNNPVLPDVIIRAINELRRENLFLKGELKKLEEK